MVGHVDPSNVLIGFLIGMVISLAATGILIPIAYHALSKTMKEIHNKNKDNNDLP